MIIPSATLPLYRPLMLNDTPPPKMSSRGVRRSGSRHVRTGTRFPPATGGAPLPTERHCLADLPTAPTARRVLPLVSIRRRPAGTTGRPRKRLVRADDAADTLHCNGQ